MSKSKGEFLTVSLLEEKGYDPLVYRLFCLQSHYRKGLVFSWENLDNAKAAYEKLIARVASLGVAESGSIDNELLEQYNEKFKEALGNDLNTSLAVTCLYDVLKAKNLSDTAKRTLIARIDEVLGLDLLQKAKAFQEKEDAASAPGEADPEIDALVAKRAEAKKAKNWAEADAIRDQLKAMGIELVYTKTGTTWRRTASL